MPQFPVSFPCLATDRAILAVHSRVRAKFCCIPRPRCRCPAPSAVAPCSSGGGTGGSSAPPCARSRRAPAPEASALEPAAAPPRPLSTRPRAPATAKCDCAAAAPPWAAPSQLTSSAAALSAPELQSSRGCQSPSPSRLAFGRERAEPDGSIHHATQGDTPFRSSRFVRTTPSGQSSKSSSTWRGKQTGGQVTRRGNRGNGARANSAAGGERRGAGGTGSARRGVERRGSEGPERHALGPDLWGDRTRPMTGVGSLCLRPPDVSRTIPPRQGSRHAGARSGSSAGGRRSRSS